jgi:hypothetical protein
MFPTVPSVIAVIALYVAEGQRSMATVAEQDA